MNCFSSNSNSTAFLPRSITGELPIWSALPREAVRRVILLRARLLLPPSTWATFLGVNQGARGAGVLVQYADQPGEAVDRDLLFGAALDVVHDDLEGSLRCLLVGNCTTKNREYDPPLGLRAEAGRRQAMPSEASRWKAYLTISGV